MRNKMKYIVSLLSLCALPAYATVEITGTVAAKCIIQVDKAGVYGNPSSSILSTAPSDGGVLPVIRFDVALADYYTANITHPNSFTSSPALTDYVSWTGSTSVTKTSDAGMSGYDASKVTYDNTTVFDLTVAGSTWFSTSSTATYAGSKPFTGGTYTSIVQASCIAK
tara:strand:+ start:986 stop:1486 length:501 start_codon:yes stop_codon:yes gene_type:complete